MPIFLDNVQCDGTEDHLIDCPSIGVGSFCFHFEDAGVKCRGTYGRFIIFWEENIVE